MAEALQLQVQAEEQRVINDTPIITIHCTTDLPSIMQTMQPNHQTCLKAHKSPPPLRHPEQHTRHHAGPIHNTRAGHRHPNQTAMFPMNKHEAGDGANWLTMSTEGTYPARISSFCTVHTPCSLMKYSKMPINYEHYACPMVHPITGQSISSYKKLMHDPATAEVWQTVFGRDFGGMAQGDNKMTQKSTNTIAKHRRNSCVNGVY